MRGGLLYSSRTRTRSPYRRIGGRVAVSLERWKVFYTRATFRLPICSWLTGGWASVFPWAYVFPSFGARIARMLGADTRMADKYALWTPRMEEERFFNMEVLELNVFAARSRPFPYPPTVSLVARNARE